MGEGVGKKKELKKEGGGGGGKEEKRKRKKKTLIMDSNPGFQCCPVLEEIDGRH